MADQNLVEIYADNPVTIDPGDLIYTVENTGTTPDDGVFKASQIMRDYYSFSVTVSSNDLVVALKHIDGNDPSTDRPLYFKIGDTLRSVTAATSITLADGTNWFNSGSAELGTKEIDYFIYLVWDSNSSVVAISIARIPFGRLVSDFSATTTNEKYLGNYANFMTTDDVAVIGRCAATLSLSGTSHVWTVPTFTSLNLIKHPVYETRWLTWTPTHSRSGTNYTNLPTTETAIYKIRLETMSLEERHQQNATPGGTNFQQFTTPFTVKNTFIPCGLAANETTALAFLGFFVTPGNIIRLFKAADATAEATANQRYHTNANFPI